MDQIPLKDLYLVPKEKGFTQGRSATETALQKMTPYEPWGLVKSD